MDLGPHAGFIVTAYAVAIVIVAGLIVWVVLDRRHLARTVDELEGKGVTRRSERAAGDAASVEKP
jgi:heme exporter protein D